MLEGAPLERAANVAVFYGMLNGGQSCVSIERVYVAGVTSTSEFVARVTEKVAALRVGAPRGAGRRSTSARSPPSEQLEIIEAHVADALAQGRARRGRRPRARRGRGRFYEPTVLLDVDHSMRCMVEETFGPTLPVMAVADAEQAVALVNDSRMGLGAAVFAASTAERRGDRAAARGGRGLRQRRRGQLLRAARRRWAA